jgi:excinuclease ABC subunit A
VDVVVDRLVVRTDARSRLADAVELSLSLGEGLMRISREKDNGDATGSDGRRWIDQTFSEDYFCMDCGRSVSELTPRAFSFNSPYGACEACGGLGTARRFDPGLIVPDCKLSLSGGAIEPWSDQKKRLMSPHAGPLKEFCAAAGIAMDAPFDELSEDARQWLLHGTRTGDARKLGAKFEGVIPNLQKRWDGTASETARNRLAAYQSEQVCDACHGARLKPESLAVRVADKNIAEMTALSVASALRLVRDVRLEGEAAEIARPIMQEVATRLHFMDHVGLGYLTLNRASATLSGGEAQRIRLATQIGSGLVGVCYVLDEPTIGLHQRDTERLIASIRRMVDIGNSVLVVEHDEDTIRAADHIIEIGPGAGLRGGRIMAEGPAAEVLRHESSITGKFINGEYAIPIPEERRPIRRSEFIEVRGARQNNLKNIDVRFPLGILCAITGVSGSGKSTLVNQTLVSALRRRLMAAMSNAEAGRERFAESPGLHDRLVGAHRIDKIVQIDQTPIGRTPRSNPATYTGAFDEIRRLYARTREAKIRGYKSGRFSFNVKGGRCEACQGQGTRRIEMHFLPDIFVECQDCRGTRYARETLEVRYRGKSIADVLDMRIEEAIQFFDSFPKIRQWIQALSDVGLGYMRLGQASNTLSGGEAQRVKLAAELGKPSTGHTLYMLDEPTTGLHFADIQTLLAVLNRLVDKGNTVLVTEHNLDVIKCADWLIDLGPEGGDGGGQIIVEGTPEEVAASGKGHTSGFLARKLATSPSV